jgi:hypothetical protein
MSGEVLRVMMVSARSTPTVVRRRGGSPSTSACSSSHSPSASRVGRLKRVLVALPVAPLPCAMRY